MYRRERFSHQCSISRGLESKFWFKQQQKKFENHGFLKIVLQKTNENNIQQHRLRCSVAPSDAKDDEFSGNLSGSGNPATVKLLQDIIPQLNKVLDEQEKLRKQLKDIRILLLFLMILSFIAPFYFSRSGSL